MQALAGRAALVQAQVGIGVELALPVEHADVVGAVLDDLAIAVREIRNLGDKDFGHFVRLREVVLVACSHVRRRCKRPRREASARHWDRRPIFAIVGAQEHGRRATMIVDIYTHIFPDRFFQELERGSPKLGNMGKRLRAVRKLFDLDLRFKDMDAIGKDYRQIISLPNPPIEDIAEGEVANNLARVANDSMAELVRQASGPLSGVRRGGHRCTTSISPSPRPTAPSRWARAACRPSPTSPAIRSTSRASGRSSPRWPRTTCRSGCIRRAPRRCRTTRPSRARASRCGGASAGPTRPRSRCAGWCSTASTTGIRS